MQWMPGEATFAQTSEDKLLRLWDSRALSKPAIDFTRQQYFPCCCDISADGNLILTGSNGFDGHGCYVTLWDARKGGKVVEMQGHTQRVTGCVFIKTPNESGSTTKQLAATASIDGTIRLWDIISGECLELALHSDVKFNDLAPVCGPGGTTNLVAATSTGLMYMFALRVRGGAEDGYDLHLLSLF